MSRSFFGLFSAVWLLTLANTSPAAAQQMPQQDFVLPQRNAVYSQPMANGPMSAEVPAQPAAYANRQPGVGGEIPQQDGYPQLGASLYPSPSPNVPYWTGGSFITNPAFAPHEMLYAHTYRALYPPYYHKVKGAYMWTPFGMRTHENWQLQGTMVQVKYRSHYPIVPGFHPPHTSMNGGLWR